MAVADIIGLVGAVLLAYCYARIQWQREFAKQLSFSLLNLLGALLLGYSLTINWNLPAFILDAELVVISLYGTYRCLKYMRRAKVAQARIANFNARVND